MPTPSSEIRSPKSEVRNGEWAARTDTPKRSVFGNYRADGAPLSEPARLEAKPQRAGSETGAPLQAAIDLAVARSFIHRYLAKAYEDPTPESWRWLCDAATQENLRAAWDAVQRRTGVAPVSNFSKDITAELISKDGDRRDACPTFSPDAFDSFLNAYLAAFGHAARGSCPLNEIEYGDIKADPLFQPHRLADLAAFYRAFGLEVAEDAGERHDHICLELEFLCVLAAKEAYALEHQLDGDQLAQCRDAQKKFLREHLGRWTPAFARRLAAATNEPTLRAMAEFTRAFIESECVRFGVNPGSEELSLRPVDEAADRMCDSCGINNLPPGALAAT
jgi:DMSO reductase family type II enzyme chaperone